MSLTKIGSIGINTGIAFAGVTTITTLNGSDAVLSVGGTVNFNSDVSIGGSVSIGGTLTYEDVTNIDSVGLITARNGIVVGSGITLSKDGDGFFTGVVTATSYAGDGSGLTGIAATDNVRTGILDVAGVGTFRNDVNVPDKIIHLGDTDTAIRFPAADTVTVETGGSEAIRVDSSQNFGVGTNSPTARFDVRRGDTDGKIAEFHQSTGFGIDIGSSQSEAYISSGSGQGLIFKTDPGSGQTERLRIGSAGQLGIGGANYGESGQVLTSQGSGSVVQWATPAAWVYGTAADYDQWNSTTDVRFSGWPSTWQQIRVSFIDISINANAYVQFFVSKSSDTASRIASGYETTSGYWGSGTAVNSVTDMGRFNGTGSSAYSMNGYVNFFKFSGDKIRFEGQLANKNDVYIFLTNGYVTCDPTSSMTHIFFRGQGYSYDAGKFKLDYLA